MQPGSRYETKSPVGLGRRLKAAGRCAGRVLVVEDEFITAQDVMQRLIAMDFEPVGHAARAEDGFRLAAELRPDLLLTDIRLAGDTDGVELAVRVRQQLDIPSIFISASLCEDVMQRASIASPVACLNKPLQDGDLRAALLAWHRQSRFPLPACGGVSWRSMDAVTV